MRLQEAARLLEANVRTLANTDPAQRGGLAMDVSARVAELLRDVVSARSQTQGPGGGSTGDAELWDSVAAALRRADGQLHSLAGGPGQAG